MLIPALLSLVVSRVPDAFPPQPEVGFVWHFPFVDVGTPEIRKSGTDAMIARGAWASLEPAEGRFDWSNLDRQLKEAREGGFKLVLLLEINPFAAPKWVADKVGAAGESGRNHAGNVAGLGPHGEIPQADSKVFAETQTAFLRALVDYVKKVDPQHTITTYQPGIEWWLPYDWRYAPADVDRFRAWMGTRYGSVEALNRAWRSDYRSFGEVEAPQFNVKDLYLKGRTGLGPIDAVGPKPAFGNWAAAAYDFSQYWETVAARMINDTAARVKALDTSRPTMSWITNAYAIGSEWDYVQWSQVPLDEVARKASAVDVLGMQLAASYGDPYRISVGLDVARKYGKPMCVLDLLDFSLGSGTGFANMMRATHASVQHGATSFFYCNWNGAKDFNFYPDWKMADLQKMITEAKAALVWSKGTKPLARGAIVDPYLPTVATPWLDAGTPHSFMGWYKLLQRAGETVDVVTPREMADDPKTLSKYAFVMLPDCPVVDAKAAAALRSYAKTGRLLLGGRPPTIDPYRRAIAPGFPVSGPHVASLPDLGRAYVGDPVRNNAAGDTPPLFVLPQTGGHDAARTLRQALTKLRLPPLPLALRGGAEVARTDFRYAGGRGVYLVNGTTAPVGDVRLRVPSGSKVRALVDGLPRSLAVQDGEVALPPFERAAIVKVDAR